MHLDRVSDWLLQLNASHLKCMIMSIPLRMESPNGEFGSQKFNDFADSLMNPILNKHPLTDTVANAGTSVLDDSTEDEYTVEVIKKSRVKHGVVQYLVKWTGYNNKHKTWIDLDDMECDDLIVEFEAASALSAHVKVNPRHSTH